MENMKTAYIINPDNTYSGLSVPENEVKLNQRYTTVPVGDIPSGMTALFAGNTWIYDMFNASYINELKKFSEDVDSATNDIYRTVVGHRLTEYEKTYSQAIDFMNHLDTSKAGELLICSSYNTISYRDDINIASGELKTAQYRQEQLLEEDATDSGLSAQITILEERLAQLKESLREGLIQSANSIISKSDSWNCEMVRVRSARLRCKEIIREAIQMPTLHLYNKAAQMTKDYILQTKEVIDRYQ